MALSSTIIRKNIGFIENQKLQSPLDGNDLMALFGRPPGPWIRPIKDHLLNLVLEGQLGQDDKERAVQIAREFVAENRLLE